MFKFQILTCLSAPCSNWCVRPQPCKPVVKHCVDALFHSFFAWKDCTYTDSAGRAVPAPNANRQDPAAPLQSRYGPNMHADLVPPGVTLSTYPPQQGGPVRSDLYTRPALSYGPGNVHELAGQTSPAVDLPPRKRAREERDINEQYDLYSNVSVHPSGLSANDTSGTTSSNTENSYSRSTNISVGPDGIDRNMIRELVNRKSTIILVHPFFPPPFAYCKDCVGNRSRSM